MRITLVGSRHFGVTTLEMLRKHDVEIARVVVADADNAYAAYAQAKDVPNAVEQLTLILDESPDDPTAHNDLGYIWADHNQNLEAAEKHIRQALDLDRKQRMASKEPTGPENEESAAYIDSLGWVLFRRGKIQEAIVELEKAAAMEGGKDDPVMWDHLGDVYARLNDAGKARNAWRKSIALYESPAKRPKDPGDTGITERPDAT